MLSTVLSLCVFSISDRIGPHLLQFILAMYVYNLQDPHQRYNLIGLPVMYLQELSSEKSKTASVETRLSSELSTREQEIAALHARMKASYEEHTHQTQKLNSKVRAQPITTALQMNV